MNNHYVNKYNKLEVANVLEKWDLENPSKEKTEKPQGIGDLINLKTSIN